MLKIRRAQMVVFEDARLTSLVAVVAAEAGLPGGPAVDLVRRMARAYDLHAEEDVRTILALAVRLGQVDFDLRPENAWMHSKLDDPTISSVSRRLSWVATEAHRRQALALHNAKIAAMAGGLLR